PEARPVFPYAKKPSSRSASSAWKARLENPSTTAPTSVEARGNLAYHEVSFGYEQSKLVLRRISFQLPAGQSVAVIGPSGAGKPTLFNLLPRFFDPVNGAVLFEGVDLRDLRLKDLRAQIALVLQEPIILPTTIAENISYGKPGATLDQIEAAAIA